MNDPRTCIYGNARKFGAMGQRGQCTRPRGQVCLCGLPKQGAQAAPGAAQPGGSLPQYPQATLCPATGRKCPTPGTCSEPAGCQERRSVVELDYRHAEERIMAHMAGGGTFEEFAAFELAQWAGTRTGRIPASGPCDWDNWKPGRDVA